MELSTRCKTEVSPPLEPGAAARTSTAVSPAWAHACAVSLARPSPLQGAKLLNKGVWGFLCNTEKICLSVVTIIFEGNFDALASFQPFRSLNQV